MSNHIHLIISKEHATLKFPDIIRDFKKFTAMQILKAIKENPQESRKECFGCLKEQERKMGIILNINFGNKTITLRSYKEIGLIKN